MYEFQTLKVSWPWPWIGSHGIWSRSTHWPLPKYQISFESDHPWKKLLDDRWTYIHTYIWMADWHYSQGVDLNANWYSSIMSKCSLKKEALNTNIKRPCVNISKLWPH